MTKKQDFDKDIHLSSFDNLFQTDESREEMKREKLMDIPISQIKDFPNHPYRVKDDENIPENDTSFNFIVGMLYTQLFQQLYYQADFVHTGRLPVHVHFVMDEFANIALPDDFDKLLSTMRSREISVSIIIQNTPYTN